MSVAKKNMRESVFQRLKNQAKSRGENLQFLLMRYAVERILYRVSTSSIADKFILKGAGLFLVWKGQSYRTTKDVDFLGFGSAKPEDLTEVFIDLCKIDTVDIDGIAKYDHLTRPFRTAHRPTTPPDAIPYKRGDPRGESPLGIKKTAEASSHNHIAREKRSLLYPPQALKKAVFLGESPLAPKKAAPKSLDRTTWRERIESLPDRSHTSEGRGRLFSGRR